MSSIRVQRCFNHARREAVARCIVCGNYFCRECITEHNGKMTCGRCLSAGTSREMTGRLGNGALASLLFICGLFVLWLTFFLAGRAILSIPASIHEGTIWAAPGAKK